MELYVVLGNDGESDHIVGIYSELATARTHCVNVPQVRFYFEYNIEVVVLDADPAKPIQLPDERRRRE
jgi:hypothetical protein